MPRYDEVTTDSLNVIGVNLYKATGDGIRCFPVEGVPPSPFNFAGIGVFGGGINLDARFAVLSLRIPAPTTSTLPFKAIFFQTFAADRTLGQFDNEGIAGDTALWLFDVNSGTLKRVSVGAVDSGGAGFRVLRIPN